MTKKINRRSFLDRSKNAGIGLVGGLTLLSDARSARATPANDKIVLGLIGCGGRGGDLARGFAKRDDCTIAMVADVDDQRMQEKATAIGSRQGGNNPTAVGDFRKILDDKSIDAVVIAAPDHWHALATVWACQAGKDVYVEKPPTHNCLEGQKMIEAARKYKRVVQCGFQNRSAPYNRAAKKYIEEGKLGDIHLCRIYNQKPPRGGCPTVPDEGAPVGLNWEMWNGPAPEHAYNKSMHKCWQYQWRYTGGDLANDASHQIDLARWLLGVKYPKTVYSTGGQFHIQSASQTPDTLMSVFEFDKLLMSIDLTLFTPYMLKTDSGVRDMLY